MRRAAGARPQATTAAAARHGVSSRSMGVRGWLQERLGGVARAPAPAALPPVPRVAAPAPADFERDYVRPGRPVVLTGLLDGWGAQAAWSLPRLAARHRDAPVAVARVRDGAVVVDPARGLLHDATALGAFGAAVQAGAAAGYVVARAEDLPAALRRELPVPPYCAGAAWRASKLWIAGGETVA